MPLSHGNLLASAHAVRLAWRWTPEDTLALCLPLFHVHGLGVGLHGTLVTGAGALLVPFSPPAIADAVTGGASLLFGVPTMYHRLAESPHLADLRRAAARGQRVGAAAGRAARGGPGRQRSGRARAVRHDRDRHARLQPVRRGAPARARSGFPLPGVEVRLDPREGGTAEIEVRGPNVIAGYLDDPAATAAAFTSDGWFRTGDLGHAGRRRVPDHQRAGQGAHHHRRLQRLPARGGGAAAHPPGVADAAVVGAPSAQWGETVVAFVVPSAAGSTANLESELDAWCGERLVAYKRPREWRLVESIPRNALGKILRHLLVP